MDKATQEGAAVGIEGNEKNIIDESLLKKNSVLSEEKDEEPGMTECQKDAREMMDKRGGARQKGDKLKGDVWVDALLKSGDQCVNDPTGPLTIKVNTSSTQEEIVNCTESAKTTDNQVQYFFRNLKLNIVHQDRIVKKRCARKITRCTRPYWGRHRDDDPECDTYTLIENGHTHDIGVDQDCTQTLGWKHYSSQIVTTQYESTVLNGEAWILDDPSDILERIRSNACNLVKTECVAGPETRYFHGVGFYKDCWRQRITAFCPVDVDETNGCSELRKKGCQQIDEECVQNAADG